jgi:hypothetical protein
MNWRKAETGRKCPIISNDLHGSVYLGSYSCLKCGYNFGYDKEAGLIKCAKESEIWPDLRENLRKDLREELRDVQEAAKKLKTHAYIAFGIAITGMTATLISALLYFFI